MLLPAGVVVTVSTEACADVPTRVTDAGEKAQVAGSLAATGLIAQLRATVPVNPFVGVIEIVDVLKAVAPGAMLMGVPPIANAGEGVTVKAIIAEAFSTPDVPLIVTVTGPARGAALLALSVSTLVLVAGLVANVPVTPVGKPLTESVTAALNPLLGVTVIVSVVMPPSATCTDGEEAESANTGEIVTVNATVVVAVTEPEVPVMVTATGPAAPVALLADNVRTCVPVAVPLANVAVTPLGRPLAARLTTPLKPPCGVMAIVSVVLSPCPVDSVELDGAMVNPGVVLLNHLGIVTLPAGLFCDE